MTKTWCEAAGCRTHGLIDLEIAEAIETYKTNIRIGNRGVKINFLGGGVFVFAKKGDF